MANKGDIIVGLDIGTTKVAAVVGEVTEDGTDIIGIGSHPSAGLHKGVVVNIDATCDSINKAVDEAEQMAGVEISTVYAGIAGGHISSFNNNGIVAVKNREITKGDVDRVIEQAKAVAIPLDREVIHAIPQGYVVDDQDGVRNPIGMNGVRLEGNVHIITGAVTSAQNIVKCAQRCNLNVADIVLEQIASSNSVLYDDEKELGVAMVDIGGGTTDLIIYVDGAVAHTSVISIGGKHLTADIAMGLRTPKSEAEIIKKLHGCALLRLVDPDETIEVPSVGGRPPVIQPKEVLAHIIEPRIEEMFMLVQRAILESGYAELLASGLVVTGGASLLEGLPEAAEEIIGMPVRRGIPFGFGEMGDLVANPIYATGAGLVNYGARMDSHLRSKVIRAREQKVYPKVLSRMSGWFKEIF
ncbi:MAG: cell division protein FtsA [Deltaproteobacteria bacterium]|jgi:cell division protein FtsA|nr:cell division protein FtsA [Deltaproteobacteria bacterium]